MGARLLGRARKRGGRRGFRFQPKDERVSKGSGGVHMRSREGGAGLREEDERGGRRGGAKGQRRCPMTMD